LKDYISTSILAILLSVGCFNNNLIAQPTPKHQVSELRITTLSTMLADRGHGEWGYSALVEIGQKKILFDTGRYPETVLNNAQRLGIDLSEVEDVVLSHNHGDHTGGVLYLREHLKSINPKAISRIHVGKGIFTKRVGRPHSMQVLKDSLEADGVEFKIYDSVLEIFPGVWLTGNVPRKYDEKNYNPNSKLETKQGEVVDIVAEDMSLFINTTNGIVLLSGCGHSGIINTMALIQSRFKEKKITTAIGGFHLLRASDEQLKWTANQLKLFGLQQMNGAHCTGINSLVQLRDLMKGSRQNYVVGSVGDLFTLEQGIRPGAIAR